MSAPHPFDAAIALAPAGSDAFSGHSHPAYWNMIGPFGGLTAAMALNAVLQHPQLLGAPISLTVNFAGPVGEGPITARARPARTNRSTQHWWVELVQTDADGTEQVSTTATVVTAARRPTWSASDATMPTVPAPDGLPRSERGGTPVAWIARYEVRSLQGDLPRQWDGQTADDSLTRWWLRDDPPRPLDFASLTAMADVFFPRVWLRRATRVPVGTVSMTVYFHADSAQLAACGDGHLLAEARALNFRHGFFDQTGLLWNAQGHLLCSTHQIVYYKE
ncbi:acyl-CoA thioesterase [Pseudaquabacterium pictum]|uniref:Acyl-CoA thioesterase n=1 Tax=Pseudaquabacterium pictum TaxID=2315236 RepID=A0A480ASQ2_9BURK|nr:thioesterase family protein [Rubrivivax pictus]GCL63880.1 acyl-CoA thioesterase [Rubrivivax pictus]